MTHITGPISKIPTNTFFLVPKYRPLPPWLTLASLQSTRISGASILYQASPVFNGIQVLTPFYFTLLFSVYPLWAKAGHFRNCYLSSSCLWKKLLRTQAFLFDEKKLSKKFQWGEGDSAKRGLFEDLGWNI